MASTFRMQVLGDFLLAIDNAPIRSLHSPRLQSLLTYLVLHRSAPQDRSRVAFLLWPDSTETHAHASLRKLLHQLRQNTPELEQFVAIERETLSWQPPPGASLLLDIEQIEQALSQAQKAAQAQDIHKQRQALEQVMQLYRGDLLPGCYDEWLLPERDHWRQLYLDAAQRLVALLEDEPDYPAAIAVAQQLLRHDPLTEANYRHLMRLYALNGDRAAAQRVYHTCVGMLERELGTEPGEVTRTLFESLSDTTSKTGSLGLRGTASPLLGRKAEWRQLQEEWRKAARGQARMLVLTGEAGIGKTRLAEELYAWVSRQDLTTANARCYSAPGQLAYAPITTLLRSTAFQASISTLDPTYLTEIARLLPEVLAKRPKLPRPAAMTESWQRQQFFEALARTVLSTRQPILLLLDDLQWCDNESLEWLYYLLRFDPEARLLLIGTVRAEETRPDHPLLKFLSGLQRDNLVSEIALKPLSTTDATSLAEHILGQELDSTMSSVLYRETEGNPLFIVEMARAGLLEKQANAVTTNPEVATLLTRAGSSLPSSVQNVLAARLAQLSPLAHSVANVAAVIGREFSFAILARASGEREEAVVQGLDELWERRIVREQGDSMADAYDFSHDKLREQVYASLSPAQRRLLHRRVAEAFKAVRADVESSGQIASHYERAGQFADAIPYYLQAGEAARQIFANTEALQALERASALLEVQNSRAAYQMLPWETALNIYEALGDVLLELGSYDRSRDAYQQATAWIPVQAIIPRARMQWKTGRAWNYGSNNPHSTNHINAQKVFQEAERLLRQKPDPEKPAWRDAWIDLHLSQLWPLRGSGEEMAAVIEKVRPLIEQHGTPDQRKALEGALGMNRAIRHRFANPEFAIDTVRASLAEAIESGNKGEIGTRQMALGIILLWSNQLDEAREQLESALHLAEQLSITWMQTRCLTFLPFIFRKRGQVQQVRDLLTRAATKGADQDNNIIAGHHAWLARREGNLAEAERYARISVENQPMEVNPFQWVGIWPLLAVMLARGDSAASVEQARQLLDQTQQPPPEPLKTRLEEAVRAWDAGERKEVTQAQLQEIVLLAEQQGYL